MTIARPPILADADAGFLELCASFATTLAHVDASSSVRGGDASAGDAMIWQVAPAMRTVLSEDVSHSRGTRVPPGRKDARAVSADLALKKGRTKAPQNTQLKPTKDNTFRPFREESEFLKICNEQMHLFSAMVLSLTAPMAPRAAFSTRSSLIRMDDIRQTRVSNVVESNRPDFQCSFEIPKKGIAEYGECQMKFKPLLATGSECVVVRYDLPFGLAAEPRGRVVVVTKDGPGGEKVGDMKTGSPACLTCASAWSGSCRTRLIRSSMPL